MSQIHPIDVLGFFGACCTLLAFFNVSHGRWSGQSYRYQCANLIAGVSLAAYAWNKHAFASVFLNVVWCMVGAYGLYVVYSKAVARRKAGRRS